MSDLLPLLPQKGFPRISPEHAQALGYVVARWSRVEEVTAQTAATLLGLFEAPGGPAVWAEMSGAARFALVRTLLVETRIQEWLDDWDDLGPRFAELRSRRNDAVHSVWELAEGKHWAFRVRSTAGVIAEYGELSADDLVKLEREIDALLKAMFTFFQRVHPVAATALREASQRSPLVPGQGRRARAQAQARAAKQVRKAADRERDQKPPT